MKIAAPIKKEPEKLKRESSNNNTKSVQPAKPVFTKKTKAEEKKDSDEGGSEDELSE